MSNRIRYRGYIIIGSSESWCFSAFDPRNMEKPLCVVSTESEAKDFIDELHRERLIGTQYKR